MDPALRCDNAPTVTVLRGYSPDAITCALLVAILTGLALAAALGVSGKQRLESSRPPGAEYGSVGQRWPRPMDSHDTWLPNGGMRMPGHVGDRARRRGGITLGGIAYRRKRWPASPLHCPCCGART